jgi:hypothetical protein
MTNHQPRTSNPSTAWQVAAIVGWGVAIFAAMLAWHYRGVTLMQAAAPAPPASDVERRVKAEEITRVCAEGMKNLTLAIGAECPALSSKLQAAGAQRGQPAR